MKFQRQSRRIPSHRFNSHTKSVRLAHLPRAVDADVNTSLTNVSNTRQQSYAGRDTAYPRMLMLPIELIAQLFAGEGLRSYLGEEVSIATRMLQAAVLAQSAGAADHLVAAALLHDVGHFQKIGRRKSEAHQLDQRDYRHEDAGADWLAQSFPEEVTEPVRLHVQAKRYLCTVDPG